MDNMRFFRWNIVTNVLMALSINTAATILAGGDTLSGWVQGCCCAFTVNTVAAAIIPVGKIGAWFSRRVCGTKDSGFWEMLARNFIINAIYVTIVSFCMAVIHVGLGGHTFGVWMSTYFQLHLVGLATGLLIEKPVEKLFDLLEKGR